MKINSDGIIDILDLKDSTVIDQLKISLNDVM